MVEDLVVDGDLVGVVGVDYEAVQVGALVFEYLVEGGPGENSGSSSVFCYVGILNSQMIQI